MACGSPAIIADRAKGISLRGRLLATDGEGLPLEYLAPGRADALHSLFHARSPLAGITAKSNRSPERVSELFVLLYGGVAADAAWMRAFGLRPDYSFYLPGIAAPAAMASADDHGPSSSASRARCSPPQVRASSAASPPISIIESSAAWHIGVSGLFVIGAFLIC